MPSGFRANFPINNLKFESSDSGLMVDLLAIGINTPMPVVNPETGDNLFNEDGTPKTFAATEQLLRDAVEHFEGGILNLNHTPVKVGDISSVYFSNGFALKGLVTCDRIADHVRNNTYSGLSAEGQVLGNPTSPNAIRVTAVSFLTELPGACDKEICHVKAFAGSDGAEDVDFEASWEPAYEKYWSYIIDQNEKINQSRAKKIFLLLDGDPQNKGSWKYPCAVIGSDGEPHDDEEGLMAAYKRAAQQGETGLFSKIKSRMRKIGMEIPDGLKGSKPKLQVQYDKENKKFSASVLDPLTNDILETQEVIVVENSPNIKDGVNMPKKEEKVEVAEEAPATEKAIEAPPAKAEVPVVETPVIPEKKEEPAVKTEEVEKKEIPVIKPEILENEIHELDPWVVIKSTLGISNMDEFNQIKSAAEKLPSLENKVKELSSYKAESQKKWIRETYSPAIWDGKTKIGDSEVPKIDVVFEQYLKDPAAFVQENFEDSMSFAASKKGVKMAGSAVESVETEKTRREAEVDGAVSHIFHKTGKRR